MSLSKTSSTARRMIRGGFGRVLGAGCLALILSASLARAERAGIEQVPGNASVALSIPDAPAWWGKAHELPLVQAIQAYLKSPDVAANIDYQQFQLELSKLEKELGYSLSCDEIFGGIFSSVQVYMLPPAADASEPAVLARMGVKDDAKVDKLFKLVAEKNSVLVEFLQSGFKDSESETTGTSNINVEKIEMTGAQVLRISDAETTGPEGAQLFVARSKDQLLVSNVKPALEQALAAASAAPALAANADYKRMTAKAPLDKTDVQLWIDADALMAASGKAAMLSSMPGMNRSNKTIMALNVVPGGVEAMAVSTADPTQMTPNIKPQPLQGLGFLPGEPLAAISYGLVDAKKLYEMGTGLMGMMGGGQGGSPFDKFEQATGISVQNELVPALGQEVLFAINDFQFNPMPPYVPTVLDFIIGLQARDEEKMKVVLEKFEAWVAHLVPPQMPAGGSGAGDASSMPPPPAFKTVQTPHGALRMLETAIPGINPSYAVKNKFVIIGFNQPSVETALGRVDASATAKAGSVYQQMGAEAGVFSASTVDVHGLVDKIVGPMLPMLGMLRPDVNMQKTMQFMTSVLSHAGTASSAERLDEGLVLTKVKVQMK